LLGVTSVRGRAKQEIAEEGLSSSRRQLASRLSTWSIFSYAGSPVGGDLTYYLEAGEISGEDALDLLRRAGILRARVRQVA
jgi:hypothetical protein